MVTSRVTGEYKMELKKKDKTIAIILAGGVGSRMGASIPKQYLELAGKPILAYSLIAFEKSQVDEIIVVCDAVYEKMIRREIVEKYGIKKFSGFANSGIERVWSVKKGIAAATDGENRSLEKKSIYLLIHDGARPFISQELIADCMESVKKYNAVVPGIPLRDTIKKMSGDTVVSTPDRSNYSIVQTPQCFRADIIIKAYDKFDKADKNTKGFIPTDDASLVEKYTDTRVKMVPGDERNLKVTTPLDMSISELLI